MMIIIVLILNSENMRLNIIALIFMQVPLERTMHMYYAIYTTECRCIYEKRTHFIVAGRRIILIKINS